MSSIGKELGRVVNGKCESPVEKNRQSFHFFKPHTAVKYHRIMLFETRTAGRNSHKPSANA